MSTLKSINAQLGISATATQNFTWTAAAADGTCKLARGNQGATTQDVLTVNGSGQVGFPQGAITAAIVGGFRNLQASASGTGANVSITADELVLEDGNNAYFVGRGLSLTINTAGSGANGLDTGSLTASTWYALWVIYNPATLTFSGLISLSATAPTMPSGYMAKARVGWIRTDGSSKYPLSFKQYGRRVQYAVVAGSNITGYPLAASGAAGNQTTPTYVAVALGSFVPTTAASVTALADGASGYNIMVSPNNQTGAYNSSTNPPAYYGGNSVARIDVLLESSNIYWATNGGGYLYMAGWEDNL